MIYISGAVTNNPNYEMDFIEAEVQLRYAGYKDVINPVKITANLPQNTPYKRYIDITLESLKGCDSIFMLNGWESSKGARLEHAYAECAGMEIIYEKDELAKKKYYWRLNGNFSVNQYLRICDDKDVFNLVGIIQIIQGDKLTESEYKELVKQFKFPENMFVKEKIE